MKEDARTLVLSAQEEKRRLAIRLCGKDQPVKKIVEMTSVSAKAVSNWIKKYRPGGWPALKSRKRGKAMGTNRHLSPAQEAWLQTLLMDKTPEQIKLDAAL